MSDGESDIWGLFTLPTLTAEGLVDGALFPCHGTCRSCATRPCLSDDSSSSGGPSICRYGVGFVHIDESRTAVGFFPTNLLEANRKARRLAKADPSRRVSPAQLANLLERARSVGLGAVADFETKKRATLAEAIRDPAVLSAVAKVLVPEGSSASAHAHDFAQLAKQVKANAESLLLGLAPDGDVEKAAESPANRKLGAIYFASLLMAIKIDALSYIDDPLSAREDLQTIRVHPLVLKYVRIYNWQAQQSGMSLRVEGESYSSSLLNSDATGAMVQAFLDNMLKYAPTGSGATITLSESSDVVTVAFSSLGPKIAPSERQLIFLPGRRGSAAMNGSADGQGIGLATVKAIAEATGAVVTVDQSSESHPSHVAFFETTFKLGLPIIA